jgi:hypothetical protein
MPRSCHGDRVAHAPILSPDIVLESVATVCPDKSGDRPTGRAAAAEHDGVPHIRRNRSFDAAADQRPTAIRGLGLVETASGETSMSARRTIARNREKQREKVGGLIGTRRRARSGLTRLSMIAEYHSAAASYGAFLTVFRAFHPPRAAAARFFWLPLPEAILEKLRE